jgi:hypothetical protein
LEGGITRWWWRGGDDDVPTFAFVGVSVGARARPMLREDDSGAPIASVYSRAVVLPARPRLGTLDRKKKRLLLPGLSVCSLASLARLVGRALPVVCPACVWVAGWLWVSSCELGFFFCAVSELAQSRQEPPDGRPGWPA